MTDFWFGFITALVIAYLWHIGNENAKYRREQAKKQGREPEDWGY